MRFGLIANLKRKGALQAIQDFINWADTTGTELILCEELSEISNKKLVFSPRNDIPGKVDIIVSMGGDGTLLATARLVASSGIPVLGINLGSLGFLTQLTPKQLIPALDKIVDGNYQLESRMLLKTEVVGNPSLESPYALNDVVVDNGPVSRIIKINLAVNGEDVVTYLADGLVISTPTGSTAYSLAVGGPIMHPKMEAMIAAPISSFSLSTRPMIFSSNDTLEITIHSEHGEAGLTLDGQVMVPLKTTDKVKIVKADFGVNLIVFPENSYYQLLKNKLHWGISPLSGSENQ